MLLFLIGALRAIVEMLGLCCLAQGFLYLLTGQKRASNPIYQLFALITQAPRRLVAFLPPLLLLPAACSRTQPLHLRFFSHET